MARVTVPICVPAVLDITYLFVNAMTTVSAVIFSIHTKLAAVTSSTWTNPASAAAAAMAMTIVATSAAVKITTCC
jgi:iron(III) transport system permease protein